MGDIVISPGYGYKQRQPFISLSDPQREYMTQLTPDEARSLGRMLVEAAEAAEQDAFLFEFTSQKMGADQPGAVMLREYRQWRARRMEQQAADRLAEKRATE